MSYVTSVTYSNSIGTYRQVRDCNSSSRNCSRLIGINRVTVRILNNNFYSSASNVSRSNCKGNGLSSTHRNILRSYSNLSISFLFNDYLKIASGIPIACTCTIICYSEITISIRQCNGNCSYSLTIDISGVIMAIDVYNNLTFVNSTTIPCSGNSESNSGCITSIAFNCCIGYFCGIHVRIEITTWIIFSYLSIICIFIMDSISVKSTIIQL